MVNTIFKDTKQNKEDNILLVHCIVKKCNIFILHWIESLKLKMNMPCLRNELVQ
jgi:hypothetical protein